MGILWTNYPTPKNYFATDWILLKAKILRLIIIVKEKQLFECTSPYTVHHEKTTNSSCNNKHQQCTGQCSYFE